MRRALIPVCTSVLLLLGGVAFAASPKTDLAAARGYVQDLGNRTIQTLKKSDYNQEERFAEIRGMLVENLDLPRIARVVIGRTWRSLSPQQREEYQTLFSEYVLTKYALFLNRYQGEVLKVTDSVRAGRRDALVVTSIIRDGQPWAEVGWRVTTRDGRMMVLDVKIEKISLIQTEQSQIQSILRQKGFDGLLDMLRAQLTKLNTDANGV